LTSGGVVYFAAEIDGPMGAKRVTERAMGGGVEAALFRMED